MWLYQISVCPDSDSCSTSLVVPSPTVHGGGGQTRAGTVQCGECRQMQSNCNKTAGMRVLWVVICHVVEVLVDYVCLYVYPDEYLNVWMAV